MAAGSSFLVSNGKYFKIVGSLGGRQLGNLTAYCPTADCKHLTMNWGKGIILSFVLFAIFIGALVAICVRQDLNLVAQDYYKQELDYQQQIERQQNASTLASKPNINVEDNFLNISFDNFSQLQKGEVNLFRPSNPAFDKSFVLSARRDSLQQFDISAQPSGMYKASMTWSSGGKEFYVEKVIYH